MFKTRQFVNHSIDNDETINLSLSSIWNELNTASIHYAYGSSNDNDNNNKRKIRLETIFGMQQHQQQQDDNEEDHCCMRLLVSMDLQMIVSTSSSDNNNDKILFISPSTQVKCINGT